MELTKLNLTKRQTTFLNKKNIECIEGLRWNIPSADLVLFLFERSGRMGKVLIWFVIIISTVVFYCLMKVKAESDELYTEHHAIWQIRY